MDELAMPCHAMVVVAGEMTREDNVKSIGSDREFMR